MVKKMFFKFINAIFSDYYNINYDIYDKKKAN